MGWKNTGILRKVKCLKEKHVLVHRAGWLDFDHQQAALCFLRCLCCAPEISPLAILALREGPAAKEGILQCC